MRKITLALILLFSGCICCCNQQPGYAVPSTTIYQQATTSSTQSDSKAYPTTTETTPSTSSTSSTTSTASTTSSTIRSFDYSKLAVQIAGCDDDYYGNAKVAGFVINPTDSTAQDVEISTYLLGRDDEVVSQGKKTVYVGALLPGQLRKFSVLYEKPPAWRKCKAEAGKA